MIAWALIPGVRRSAKLFVPLVLMLGILPDADLFLEGLGIMHRTLTHSFLFWTVLFIPFFFVFRLKSIPYFVAVVQHFAFGDLLMGKVMLLWPFNSHFVGFAFGMPSSADVAFEMAGVLLAAAILIYSGSLKRLLSVRKSNVFMLVPLLALLISGLFFVSRWSSIDSLISYILSDGAVMVLAVGHLILLVFLAASSLQGLRALKGKFDLKAKLRAKSSR